jgi:membrane fusion protein, macrolide-specific efflux system
MNILKAVFAKLTKLPRWFWNATLIKKIIVVASIVGMYFLLTNTVFKSATTKAPTIVAVKTGSVTETVNESGNIQSNQVNIYSSTDGVITELYVENGDTVTQNQKLFKVKSTANAEEKADAYARYVSALASLNNANNSYRSAVATVEKVLDEVKGHDTDESFSQRETRTKAEVARDNAYESVKSSQANFVSAQLEYQKTQDSTAVAPLPGIIANLGYSVGDNVEAVSGSGTAATGTPVLIVGTSKTYEIRLQLSEVEINKVKESQKATITVDAIKDKTFNGSVTRVDDYGTETSGIISFNVYVKLEDPIEAIKPLMGANVTIETAKSEDVLLVPNSAVKSYQGGKAVQIIDRQSGETRYLPVKIGLKGSTHTEILEGLKEGQLIVTSSTTSTTSLPSTEAGNSSRSTGAPGGGVFLRR